MRLRYKGAPKEKYISKPIKLPKIITEDLTYFMQFGYEYIQPKRSEVADAKKYDKKRYAMGGDYYAE